MAFGVARLLQRTLFGGGGGGVERMLAQISRGPVQVAVARCTHARHRRSVCAVCADACPFAAIRLPEVGEAKAAAIDTEVCQGCGLCIPACPTQALFSDRWPMPAPGDHYASLACVAVAKRGAESTVPCLGAVEPVFWLTAAEHPILAYHANCSECALAAGGEALKQHVAVARNLAALQGKELLLVLQPTTGLLTAPKALRESEPTVSRRDFFRLAGREARVDALAAVLAPPPAVAWQGGRLLRQVSLRRQAIGAWLAAVGASIAKSVEVAADLPLWQIGLQQGDCSGCGLCSEVCPEEALIWREAAAPEGSESQHQATLNFDIGRCDGCRLCTDVCPQRVLQLTPAKQPFPTGETSLLRMERRQCQHCATWFSAEADEDICPQCATARNGSVAALLGRTGDDA